MVELTIYRNLHFDEWHKPFNEKGSPWSAVGGYRNECGCPYGEHHDKRFLDYKDPLHLNEILSLKEGTKILSYSNTHDYESVAFGAFEGIEFLSDFIKLFSSAIPDLAW